MTDLNTALRDALGFNGIVTKSVAVCEVVDAIDGERKLIVIGGDCPIWDAVGMLTLVQGDLIDTYINVETVYEEEEDGED